MRIGFDATALVGPRAGVGNYTQHLLSHLLANHADHEYVMLLNRPSLLDGLPHSKALQCEVRAFPSRLLWMQTVLPGLMRDQQIGLCHFPNSIAPVMSEVPYVVTVHDMTLSLMPNYHPWRRRFVVRCMVPLAARRARRVITVSASAQRDIIRLLRLPPSRVCVVPEAAAPHFRPVSAAEQRMIRSRYGLHKPYLLYVGTLEPRKNLVRLIHAWHRLRQQKTIEHQLVIVGGDGWQFAPIYQTVRDLDCGDDVRFTGYLPAEDLPAIFCAADAFAFPSLYEGFGLPVIEALACATPTLISTTPALLEVAGDAALAVDPLDIDAIKNGLECLLTNEKLRDDLRVRGLRRAASFSWAETARQTLHLYEQVMEEAAPLTKVARNPATDEA